MSKKCAFCGENVGFFSGKFIEEKYVCRACYELNEIKKLNEPQDDKVEKYPWTKIAKAWSKPSTYQPWSWSSNKKDKQLVLFIHTLHKMCINGRHLSSIFQIIL